MDGENRYEFPLWADVAYTTLLFHAELEKLTKNMKNAEHLFQSLPRWCLCEDCDWWNEQLETMT